MELVHLGSLYHDDVIDEAETRRGVPSVNARWSNIVAILTEADMTVTDIVSITTYVIDGEPLSEVMAVRDRVRAVEHLRVPVRRVAVRGRGADLGRRGSAPVP